METVEQFYQPQASTLYTVNGARGRDKLFGGSGDDVVNGGVGRDELFGDDGDDKLFGHRGRDVLNGGTGHDKADGGPQRDECAWVEHETSC